MVITDQGALDINGRCVVDEHIDASKLFDSVVDCRNHLGFIADVNNARQTLTASLFNCRGVRRGVGVV